MSFQLSKTYRPERQLITENYRLDEKTAVDNLLKTLDFTQEQEKRITDNAIKLINKLRHLKQKQYGATGNLTLVTLTHFLSTQLVMA